MGKWVHRLSSTDEKSMTGVCDNCGPVNLKKKKDILRCAIAVKEQRGKRYPYEVPPEKRVQRYKASNGNDIYLTRADRETLFAQSSQSCGICERILTFEQSRFDHCHETGKHRGFLCHSCNTALGVFGDNVEGLQKAIDYLNA